MLQEQSTAEQLDSEEDTKALIRRFLKEARDMIRYAQEQAPRLWMQEAPLYLVDVLSLIDGWTHDQSINLHAIEECRSRFADAVEAVRHARHELDGTNLLPKTFQRHPECSIGGLIGSGVLIVLTTISCLECPLNQASRHPPSPSERAEFALRSLQEARERLHQMFTASRTSSLALS